MAACNSFVDIGRSGNVTRLVRRCDSFYKTSTCPAGNFRAMAVGEGTKTKADILEEAEAIKAF
jgi:hypothetical protein